jgi:hypothetical protein
MSLVKVPQDNGEGEKKSQAHGEHLFEVNGLALGLLLTTKLEVLATLECLLVLVSALGALESQHDLLRGLGLCNMLVNVSHHVRETRQYI